MRLTLKITLLVIIIVTLIITTIFFIMAQRQQTYIEKHLLTTARTVYNNIVIVRKWISDHEGVFVVQRDEVNPNPFLDHPILRTTHGDTLILRNPAMVTRELSDLSYIIGKDYSFHLTSLKYINPNNRPDQFERQALIHFEETAASDGKTPKEFYQSEQHDGKPYFRYFAPLYTEKSCLSCHRQQGYELGDVRGGISIMLPMQDHLQNKRDSIIFILVSALLTIAILSLFITVVMRRIIIRPLRSLEVSAENITRDNYEAPVPIPGQDELGRLASAFEAMRNRIRQYTKQLIASENKYRNLIEHSIEAVAITSESGDIIDCNQKLVQLTGYDEASLKSTNFFELIDWKNKRVIHQPADHRSEHFESSLLTKFNQRVPIEIYRLFGFELGRQRNLSFIYIRDISERKKIEQYANQTEKMFALGQLSSGIAHEIRNPLFALNNNLDYLNKHFENAPHFKEVYPEFKDSINRMQHIITAILDFAKPHELSFERLSPDVIINKSLTLVKKQFEKSAITIQTHFQHDGTFIEGDEHQLEQVFVNLFLNAFQAMKSSGKLTVKTFIDEPYLIVEIADTGCGIPADEINRIFYPFYSKSPQGTGLGMAIVQRILEQHDAHYEVQSEVGLGTTFRIHFKRAKKEN